MDHEQICRDRHNNVEPILGINDKYYRLVEAVKNHIEWADGQVDCSALKEALIDK